MKTLYLESRQGISVVWAALRCPDILVRFQPMLWENWGGLLTAAQTCAKFSLTGKGIALGPAPAYKFCPSAPAWLLAFECLSDFAGLVLTGMSSP
jgi:hypothetical protein